MRLPLPFAAIAALFLLIPGQSQGAQVTAGTGGTLTTCKTIFTTVETGPGIPDIPPLPGCDAISACIEGCTISGYVAGGVSMEYCSCSGGYSSACCNMHYVAGSLIGMGNLNGAIAVGSCARPMCGPGGDCVIAEYNYWRGGPIEPGEVSELWVAECAGGIAGPPHQSVPIGH